MTRVRAFTLLLACLALAVFVAGCGSDNSSDSGSSSSSAAAPAAADTSSTESTSTGSSASSGKEVEIKMQNIAFAPKDVSAKVGQTIKWTNEDTVDHDVKATEGETFKSDLFGKGGTFEYKLDKAGAIKYVCTVHPGMEGTITVTK
jgi:plastocyanin